MNITRSANEFCMGLFTHPGNVTEPNIKGSTFDAKLDGQRLGKQMQAVTALMADGKYRTLSEIAAATGAPEASASARLRDLRRMGKTVERRRRGDATSGWHEYRVTG